MCHAQKQGVFIHAQAVINSLLLPFLSTNTAVIESLMLLMFVLCLTFRFRFYQSRA